MVVSCDYSVLLAGLNTCPPYFKVESKITRDSWPNAWFYL